MESRIAPNATRRILEAQEAKRLWTLVDNPKDIAGRAKCPLHLIPGVAEAQTARALAHGAAKYGEFNWRAIPIRATPYIAAARRHLAAWTDGEDLDPESGLSHLAHVAATVAILMDAAAVGTLVDDRPKSGCVAGMLAADSVL